MRLSIVWAVLAAALYALSAPLSKLLLADVAPVMMAAWLYLGAGAGMLAIGLARKKLAKGARKRLTKSDTPYALGMILLDIAAPVLLMAGLSRTTSANAALLNNFEIVATALIALFIFGEAISRRLWAAIALITLSGMLLALEDAASLKFSAGSLLVLAACVCWGFENNCTRMMAQSDPLQIVIIKGFGSGFGSLCIAFAVGEALPKPAYIALTLALGFVAYGLSIFFYVCAQRGLGAAKTSAYYAVAPFISVLFSLIIFRELPGGAFWAALALMLAGTCLTLGDGRENRKKAAENA